MKKFWKTLGNIGIVLLVCLLLLMTCDISMVKFEDINDYKGSVILKIEHDSVGSIDAYSYTLRDIKTGEFNKININPDFHFFEEGDTIK